MKIFKKLKEEKGFGMIELIISMGLIATISIAAFTIVNLSSEKGRKLSQYQTARAITKSSLELFRFAESDDEFIWWMDNYYKDYLTKTENNSEGTVKYEVHNLYYNLTIDSKLSDSESDSFSAICTSADGEDTTLFEFTYSKD